MRFQKTFDWTKITYVLKGMLVGLIAGTVVSLFRFLVEWLVELMPVIYDWLWENPIAILPWLVVLLIAAAIVVLLVRDEPNIKGSGIPEIEGQLISVLDLRWWSVLWRKFISGLIAIGSGLALGREGPSIQLGGAVGQGVNYFLKGNSSQQDVLLSSGASAGLSAAFNAPMSGLIFILEEVHHRFSGVLILSAFSASVTANFVSYRLFGSEPALNVGTLMEFPLEHYVHLIAMGIFLALGGWLYQKVLFLMPKLYSKLPIPSYLHMFVPFLFLIPIGLFFPNMLGGGSHLITLLNQERIASSMILGVFIFRFVFMHISYGSGLPGGIFIPVLSLGAIMGALYGNGALAVTGIEDIYIRSFTIYAMGGLLTAVTKAPLTAVMLITELTGSVTQMMPLAVVCLTAYIMADFLRVEPVYEALLHRKIPRDPIDDGDMDTIEIMIENNSPFDGMTLRNLGLPYHSKLLYIYREGEKMIPRSDTVLVADDVLHIYTAKKNSSDLKQYMTRVT